jgi:orotidine-5'-phosphate decarboxylase
MNPKLIIAFDFSRQKDAINLLDQLNPELCAVKVGSEMFTLFGSDFIRLVVKRGFRVFLDLKFHDIPNTVAQACRASADLGVWMLNVHALGGLRMMEASREALAVFKERPLLIAVTVLTSMDTEDLSSIGLQSSLKNHVRELALLALQAGLDGVVCSACEVPMVKTDCGRSFLAITPGIRLADNAVDDQSRIMTPKQAIDMGSDFLVIGRPITRSPKPLQTIHDILSSI